MLGIPGPNRSFVLSLKARNKSECTWPVLFFPPHEFLNSGPKLSAPTGISNFKDGLWLTLTPSTSTNKEFQKSLRHLLTLENRDLNLHSWVKSVWICLDSWDWAKRLCRLATSELQIFRQLRPTKVTYSKLSENPFNMLPYNKRPYWFNSPREILRAPIWKSW